MENDDLNERFARWQSIAREQLTYATNLILGLAIASLGFQITLLLNDSFVLRQRWQECAFFVSLVLLAVSTLFALITIFVRLSDFRLTARTIRKEQKGEKQEAEILRGRTETLGTITWWLFGSQIATFAVGLFVAVVAIIPFVISEIF